MMEQSAVKKHFPPGAKVWKSRASGDWNAQTLGWPGAITRRINKHGEHEAIRLLVSLSWLQYMTLQGKAFNEAPYSDLATADELDS
jgi:hypothetical protein